MEDLGKVELPGLAGRGICGFGGQSSVVRATHFLALSPHLESQSTRTGWLESNLSSIHRPPSPSLKLDVVSSSNSYRRLVAPRRSTSCIRIAEARANQVTLRPNDRHGLQEPPQACTACIDAEQFRTTRQAQPTSTSVLRHSLIVDFGNKTLSTKIALRWRAGFASLWLGYVTCHRLP